MNIRRSGTIVTISTLLNAVISFMGIIILSNITKQGELGTFFLFQAVLGISSIPAAAGVNGAIEKRISQGEQGSVVLTTAVIIKSLLLIIIAAALIIAKQQINAYIGAEVTILLIICMILREGGHIVFRTMRGEKRVAMASILQMLQVVSWTFGGILLSFFGFGALGLVYSLLTSYFFMISAGLVSLQIEFGQFSTDTAKSIYQYAKYNAVTSVSGTIYVWMDTVILGLFVGNNLIAAYEIAWRVSKIGLVVSRSVSMTTFPQLSEWADEGKSDKISEIVSESLTPALIIVVPAFFGVTIIGSDILGLLYGSAYVVATTAFVTLSLERIIKSITQVITRCLHAMDYPHLSARASVLAVAANIILNFLLIPRLNILGAAIATAVSFGFKFLVEVYYLNNLINITLPTRDILAISASSIIMSIFILVVNNYLGLENEIYLLCVIITSAILYFISVLTFSSIREKMSGVIDAL